MQDSAIDRRHFHRYDLRLPIRYRISQKGTEARLTSGVTLDLSADGLSFRSRKPVPVGAHIEMVIEWPARYGDVYPVELRATGFVIRNENGRAGVRVTSHRFHVDRNNPLTAIA